MDWLILGLAKMSYRLNSFTWIIVTQFCLVVTFVTSFEPAILHSCCGIGEQWRSASNGTCLPPPSEDPGPYTDLSWSTQGACGLVAGACCLALGRSHQCIEGREAALEGQSCFTAPNELRECCSCCALGSMASHSGFPCEIPDHFSSGCRDSFVHCCRNGPQALQGKPTSLAKQVPTTTTTATTTTTTASAKRRNLCNENSCGHFCRMNGDEIECFCQMGFRLSNDRRTCLDVNECSDVVLRHNCTSGERCVNNYGGFRCQATVTSTVAPPPPSDHHHHHRRRCPSGLRWNSRSKQCDDVDECSIGHHRCVPGTTCVNTRGSYTCHTSSTTRRSLQATFPTHRPFYHASTVLDRTDSAFQVRTRSRPLVTHVHPTRAPPPATQRCGGGYRLNENGQCEDIDECSGANGVCRLPNMICRNTLGGFVCTCSIGYQFNPRRKHCEDVDECRLRRHDCTSEESCENSIGSFVCRSIGGNCTRGYSLDPIVNRCTDVDECNQPERRCSTGSVCINTPGSFRCQSIACSKGTRLDEEGKCADVDECREDPRVCGSNQVCQNTPGSYVCRSTISCGVGYELNSYGTKCEDVDECRRGSDNCRGPLMTCANRPGTYLCQCPDGYQMNHLTHSCDDIDECHKFGGHVCTQNSDCINTPGSFECNCQRGFQVEAHSKYCSDVNECLQTGMCQHSCRNTWGSYYCLCNDGYQLSRDGVTCSDIDECSLRGVESGQASELCIGLCHNIPGSYLCSCPTGYQMAKDGRTCQDIDECSTGLSNCYDSDEICLNIGGGFECRRIVCPRGFVKTPKLDIDPPHPRTRSVHISVPVESRFPSRNSRHRNGPHYVPYQTSTTGTVGSSFRPFSSNVLRGVVAQPILFLSNEDSGVVCQKVECAANDIPCILNLTKSIQWQHVALPSLPLLPASADPVTILTVQTIAGSVHPNNEFEIVAGNELRMFDVIRKPGFGDRGSVRLVRPIEGPAEFTLTLQMNNYNRYHNLISQHIAHIVINVSKYRF